MDGVCRYYHLDPLRIYLHFPGNAPLLFQNVNVFVYKYGVSRKTGRSRISGSISSASREEGRQKRLSGEGTRHNRCPRKRSQTACLVLVPPPSETAPAVEPFLMLQKCQEWTRDSLSCEKRPSPPVSQTIREVETSRTYTLCSEDPLLGLELVEHGVEEGPMRYLRPLPRPGIGPAQTAWSNVSSL